MIECNGAKVPRRNWDLMRLIALGDDRQWLRRGSVTVV